MEICKFPILFAVLGNQYGGNYSDGEFQIPNLQGQFLRGVATSTNQDPDLNSRTPANPGNPGIDPVGSTQLDALQNHAHDYQGFQQTAPAQEGTPLAATASVSTPTGSPVLPTSPPTPNQVRVSVETRPTNAYVYYLIKFS